MFDIGPTELLLIVVVAVIVIGPKDLPLALRTAGRWIGKVRKVSGQFRAGLDAMIREAELEEMETKWREQNEKIMREHPAGGPTEMEPTGAYPPPALEPPAASAEARALQSAEPETEPPVGAPVEPPVEPILDAPPPKSS
jgi:sec-independent protein translocase protein TatB